MPTVIITERNPTCQSPPKVEVIKPRKKFRALSSELKGKKRVAAYCRVSSDSDEQELSFEAQCEYYTDYINSIEDYILVGIYADEGITGTSLNKRDEFNRMMKDALEEKIDIIMTKSVARFARNTVDSLSCLRTLKEHHVDVYFETENLHSLRDSEMIITLLSSFAQESSHEKSVSVKWGYQRQFEKGKVYAANLYGYKSNHGELIIIEEEAKIVREVYAMYIQGMSDREIADNLTGRNISTKRGKKKWNASAIRSMLTNEKYTGNSRNGKTYNVDFLHPKRLKNTGQVPMYLVENSHPAIISPKIYDTVQIERARRIHNSTVYKGLSGKENLGRFKTVNTLSNLMICADCGSLYRRAVWTKRNKEKIPVWRCTNRLKNGKRVCSTSPTIKEEKLFEELTIIINDVLSRKKSVIKEIANKSSEFVNPRDIVIKIKEVEKELEEVDDLISKKLTEGMLLISRGVQDEESLKEHLDKDYRLKRKLLKERESLESKLKSVREVKEKKILKSLETMNFPVKLITQEEISIFIKEILVMEHKIQVTIVNNEVYYIDNKKLR